MKVSEPNAAEATIILRGLSAVYEQSHGVLIDDDALQAAATLSERYLSGRQLPDKAIDVLDTACARVAINLSSPPKQISALTTLSHQQEAEIRQLERELRIGLRTDTSRMTEVLVQYDETLTALDELEAARTSSRRWSGRLSRCASSYWAWQRTMRRRCRTQIPWRIRSQSQSQNRIIPVPYRLMRPTENNRKRPLKQFPRYSGWPSSLPNWTPCITTGCWSPARR